jgi:hypothetical protein
MVGAQELSNRDTVAAERLTGTLSGFINIFVTGEAHFHLSGCGNKQNCRYRAEETPQRLQQSDRVAVRCKKVTLSL